MKRVECRAVGKTGLSTTLVVLFFHRGTFTFLLSSPFDFLGTFLSTTISFSSHCSALYACFPRYSTACLFPSDLFRPLLPSFLFRLKQESRQAPSREAWPYEQLAAATNVVTTVGTASYISFKIKIFPKWQVGLLLQTICERAALTVALFVVVFYGCNHLANGVRTANAQFVGGPGERQPVGIVPSSPLLNTLKYYQARLF